MQAKHAASVQDGVLKRISVSQIESFRTCPRKWAFDKVFLMPRAAPSVAILTGTAGHFEIEKYMLTGEDTRGPFALSGSDLIEQYSKYFPVNGGNGLVEKALSEPTIHIGGCEVAGAIDFFIPEHEGRPVIIDHKFKGKIDKYGLDEAALKEDTQANVYSYWAMEATGAKEVEFRHHTHQTKGKPLAVGTSARITRSMSEDVVDRLGQIVSKEMAPLAAVASQDDVPYNQSQCWAYGGCPYSAVCNKSPQNRYRGKIEGRMKTKEAKANVKYKFADGQTGTFSREIKGMYKFLNDEGDLFTKKAEDDMFTVEAEIPAIEVMRASIKHEAENPIVTPPPAPEPAPVAKPKWTTKKKEPEPMPIANKDSNIQSFILLIDVALTGSEGQDLSGYVAAIYKEICDKFQVEDVRLGDSQGPLGFGKWKGIAAAMARANLPKGLCYLRSGELADPIIEAIRPFAKASNI